MGPTCFAHVTLHLHELHHIPIASGSNSRCWLIWVDLFLRNNKIPSHHAWLLMTAWTVFYMNIVFSLLKSFFITIFWIVCLLASKQTKILYTTSLSRFLATVPNFHCKQSWELFYPSKYVHVIYTVFVCIYEILNKGHALSKMDK